MVKKRIEEGMACTVGGRASWAQISHLIPHPQHPPSLGSGKKGFSKKAWLYEMRT
jgi:hypothetical protein